MVDNSSYAALIIVMLVLVVKKVTSPNLRLSNQMMGQKFLIGMNKSLAHRMLAMGIWDGMKYTINGFGSLLISGEAITDRTVLGHRAGRVDYIDN